MMPRKALVGGLVAAVLAGAYALAGFVLAPRWAAGAFHDYVAGTLHLQPKLDSLRINPFTLEVEARGLAISDPDGSPLIACDRLYANASLASLWHLGLALQQVVLDHPVVAARLAADRSLNLARLAPPPDAVTAGKPPGPLPWVRLDALEVHRGELGVDDLAEQPAMHAHFSPIELRLHDFATRGRDDDSFELHAVGPAGAQFTLQGHLDLQPFKMEGRFGVEQMKAVALSGYAHDFLTFDMTEGMLRLATRYRIAAEPAGLAVDVDLDALEGQGLALQARSATKPAVHLGALKLAGGRFSLAQRLFSLGTVTLDALEVEARLGKRGLDLMALLDSGEPTLPTPPAPKATPAPRPWLLTLPQLAVNDSRVHFTDGTAPQPAPFELTGVQVGLRDYSTKPGSHAALTLAATVGEAGKLAAQLDVVADAPAARGKVSLEGFDLRLVQPYLADRWRLDLQAGEARVAGQLDVAPGRGAGAAPRIAFDGDAGVRGLRTTDRLERKDFVRWETLALEGVKYRSEPAQLRVRTLSLAGPYADLVIAANGSTNISDVLASTAAPVVFDDTADDAGPAAGLGGEAAAAAPAQPAAPPAAAAAATPTPSAPTQAAPTQAAPTLAMSIDTVRIEGGSANFEDYSIKPNFATGLQQIKGSIKGLNSDPGSRATLELDGAVDKYAPTHVAGEINILSAQSYANIRASFRNMELSALSPYSGKFAGYEIERGKLSVEVSYLVQDRKLDAKHKILLTQLQLGDKVDSPDATSLPLKLVVALLKDADGNINLDIPVTGDLDDPKFRVGPIVWKMVKNLFRKVATAPFALLGKMFGGGDDLQYIEFAPGSPVLDAPMLERIANLRKALKARTALSLEIPQAGDAALDGEALREAAWQQRLEAIAPAATRADRAQYAKKLEQAYAKAYGKPMPAAPEGAAPTAPAAPAAPPNPEQQREARIGALEAALKAKVAVDPAAVDALGAARAHAIQDALLQPGEIDPIRVFITAPAPAQAQSGKVRVSLSMRT